MASAIKTRLLVSQSDEKLLELAQHGCEVAFETLARRYRRPLLRHCRQLCLSEDQAQEVLKRTFFEAWRGLQGQTQPVAPAPWLRGIAQRMAAEPALAREATLSDGASMPEDVLALRGALAAISPLPQQSQVSIHGVNGNKSHEPANDAFDFADSAVRGLLGRARRGISALTPPPLLAWLAGRAAQAGAGSERIAELGGGGAAGLGLAVKGGIAALSAGVAITGAVIATSKHPRGGSHAAHRVVAARVLAPGGGPSPGESGPVRVSAGRGARPRAVVRHRGGGGTPRSHAHLLRSGGGSSVVAPSQTTKSSGAAHVNASHAATGGAPTSAPAAASQASGAAQQSSTGGAQSTGGGAGSQTGGSSSSSSGQPAEQSGSGGTSKGVGVQVSVETGSGSQGSSSGSGGSTGSGSQSGGTGVGISVSLEPVISVGVHISLP